MALAPVLRALRDLGIRHFVGGSIASSAHGVARSSVDADVVAAAGRGLLIDAMSAFGAVALSAKTIAFGTHVTPIPKETANTLSQKSKRRR